MSRWIDKIKHRLDLIADDADSLTPLERAHLLNAAALVDQLEQLEGAGFLDGDLASSTADARAFYFQHATHLRSLMRTAA